MNNKEKEFEKFVKNHLGHKGTLGDDMVKAVGNGLNQNQLNVDASLTPYILEEREMRMTQMDIFSRLMMDRIIWIGTGIDQNVGSIVQAQLLFLDSLDPERPSTLYLDTPGGSVGAGLGIVDVMNYVKHDVGTMNTGMCASMGSVLLGAGVKGSRTSLRFSKVMTHQVSYGVQGNVQDAMISNEEAYRYNYLLMVKLAEYSKPGTTWKDIYDLSQRDRWMTSDNAKELGLIDSVIIPDGQQSMTDLMAGYEEEYLQYARKDLPFSLPR